MTENENNLILERAVAYVRMSTEHQKYSTENQEEVIRRYAKSKNIEIIKVYSDGGKSGLHIKGREALQELLSDTQNGRHDFTSILVYDISRWGRFQDADEAAHYEFLCKQAGVMVHYCAEQFENDGSISSALFKQVKRTMSGEYSRELSVKVSLGAKRLVELGYRQGGVAGYGLRRMLIDEQGKSKGLLAKGEHKSIQTDRVILVPGPDNEIQVVHLIYKMFTEDRFDETRIATELNEKSIPWIENRKWSRSTVHEILTNEKYIGNNVYNRTSFKLKQEHVKNAPELWIRKDAAFDAIVAPALFYKVQGIIEARSRKLSDDQIIEALKKTHERVGKLSGFIIDEDESLPSSSVIAKRFGGLIKAYQLVGFSPKVNYDYIQENQKLREQYPILIDQVISCICELGSDVEYDESSGLMLINKTFLVSLVLARCTRTSAGSLRWTIRFDRSLNPDITIAVRMLSDCESIRDYYVLPHLDIESQKITTAEHNSINLETYRFDDLDYFFSLTKKVDIAI